MTMIDNAQTGVVEPQSHHRFGLVLRVAVFLTGFAALQLAVPGWWHWSVNLIAMGLTPLLAAIYPKSGWATATIVIAMLAQLIIGEITDASLAAAFLIGAACYSHHATAAVAAAWRIDADIEPAVWQGWLTRQGGVLLASMLIATVIASLAEQTMPVPFGVLLTAAVCVALTMIVAIAWLFHRRD